MLTTVILFVFTFLIVYGALLTVGSVGKPRGPITPAVAVGVVIVAALAYLSTQL